MPISFAPIGKDLMVKRIAGNDKTKKHLESLGIVPERTVRVLEQSRNGIIVLVNEMRLALDNHVASTIIVA